MSSPRAEFERYMATITKDAQRHPGALNYWTWLCLGEKITRFNRGTDLLMSSYVSNTFVKSSDATALQAEFKRDKAKLFNSLLVFVNSITLGSKWSADRFLALMNLINDGAMSQKADWKPRAAWTNELRWFRRVWSMVPERRQKAQRTTSNGHLVASFVIARIYIDARHARLTQQDSHGEDNPNVSHPLISIRHQVQQVMDRAQTVSEGVESSTFDFWDGLVSPTVVHNFLNDVLEPPSATDGESDADIPEAEILRTAAHGLKKALVSTDGRRAFMTATGDELTEAAAELINTFIIVSRLILFI
jgi:hypothetical protein